MFFASDILDFFFFFAVNNDEKAQNKCNLAKRAENNKEVFVKHEQAPTTPKLEGVWVFADLKYIFYENRYFLPI